MNEKCSGCGTGVESRGALVIRKPVDAKRLLNWTKSYDSIIVAVPVLDTNENQATQSQLEQYYFECGCDAGGRAMIVALAVGPAVAWFSWPYPLTDILRWISIWFGLVFACTVVAKMAVMLKAQISLRRAIKELDGRIEGEGRFSCTSNNPVFRID